MVYLKIFFYEKSCKKKEKKCIINDFKVFKGKEYV